MIPRLVGFLNDAEREFFDLICQVDGVGVKKALQAMVRPVRDFAVAIEEQDIKTLSTLPGIGPAVAERIIAKLRRKMVKFALMISSDLPEDQTDRDVMNEGYEALLSLGHSQSDARDKIEQSMKSKKKFKGVDELLQEIYRQNREKLSRRNQSSGRRSSHGSGCATAWQRRGDLQTASGLSES